MPQPPKEPQKPAAVTRVLVRKTRPPDDIRKGVRVAVARPLAQDTTTQPLDYTGELATLPLLARGVKYRWGVSRLWSPFLVLESYRGVWDSQARD